MFRKKDKSISAYAQEAMQIKSDILFNKWVLSQEL
jgi:hypothetical protein